MNSLTRVVVGSLVLSFAQMLPTHAWAELRSEGEPDMLNRPMPIESNSLDVYSNQSLTDALKNLKSRLGGREDIHELRLHGTFRLETPVILDGLSNVKIRGIGNAELSAGTVIPAHQFRREIFLGHPVFAAPLNQKINAHEAWTDGRRLRRPSLPKVGFFKFASFTGNEQNSDWTKGQSEMQIVPGTVSNWHNLSDVELVAHHIWVTSRLPVKSLSQNLVQFVRPSVFKLTDEITGGPGVFRAENIAEALTEKDEFYIDTVANKVYVSEETWKGNPHDLVLPTLPQVALIKNCKNVTFQNVRFSNNEWCYPGESSGDGQAATSVPGAVQINDSKNVSFDRCKFEHLGTYAVDFQAGCVGCSVVRSDMVDLGGGGVKVETGSSGTLVEDCVIQGGGRLHAPAVGVIIFDSGHNTVRRNLISDFIYTGISIGWVWGYGPSQGNHNLIEGNVIFDIGQGQLSDMGGIYNLGVSPGTQIRQNLVLNIQSRGYGGWGIYLDEGSSNVLVEKNAVFGTRTGSFHQHYGQDNMVTHNLFMGAEREGQVIRTRPEEHRSFSLRENVIVWKGTPLFGGNLNAATSSSGVGIDSEGNLLRRLDGSLDLPSFDRGSKAFPSDKNDIFRQWFGEVPGSNPWWNSFGPSRGGWRKVIEPRIKEWLAKLK